MQQPYYEIHKCRVCGFAKLDTILSLGEMYFTNFVEGSEEGYMKAPLDVALCDAHKGGCGLLQLKHTFSPTMMYRQYWYRSGINKTMTDALRDITQKAQHLVNLNKGDFVVDIGSNDSTLLRSYSIPGLRTVGFEPAKNLMEYAAPGVEKVINDFFTQVEWKKQYKDAKAKVITAIAMFYDLDDPNAFMRDIVACLDDEGVFIVQQNYLPSMLARNVFDNISHEHLEYYSFSSFKYLMDKHNLEIFDIELNDVNGGSMRTYLRHKGKGMTLHIAAGGADRVLRVLNDEKKQGLGEKETYEAFAGRVRGIREKIRSFIKQEVGAGKKIYAYGASTRGNTLLQYCDLDASLITAAAERNPDKWGKKTVGTLIPIISEEDARKAQPDYFLVLPWQFLKEFREREIKYLECGGKFIAPLPEFSIIDISTPSHFA